MTIIENIKYQIEKCIERGVKEFIIYPYGIAGHMTHMVLEQYFGIIPKAIVDNGKADNIHIFDSKLLEKTSGRENILVATHNLRIYEEIKGELDKKGIIYVNMFPVEIGKHSFGGVIGEYNGYLIERIGAFCSFAPGMAVVANHNLHGVSTSAFFNGVNLDNSRILNEVTGSISVSRLMDNPRCVIGNDVWLGRNVIICNGSCIGNGVIAAAGSVITRDIPDYAVVGGVPARIIKYRYSADIIEKLLKIQWWNWPDEKIVTNYNDFENIETFISKHNVES